MSGKQRYSSPKSSPYLPVRGFLRLGVPVQMWQGVEPGPGADVPAGEPSPGADVAAGEPCPDADVADTSPVSVQMWPE